VILTVFWDHEGKLPTAFQPQRQTVNGDSYCNILSKIHMAIQRKRPGLVNKGVLLLHDNACPHTANKTNDTLRNFKWEVFQHPPYSPKLAPSDFHLFGPLKHHLSAEHFHDDEAVESEVTAYF
jgi:histone-lysine N-methyltransferase SETMAR